jgi:hypothetical protein
LRRFPVSQQRLPQGTLRFTAIPFKQRLPQGTLRRFSASQQVLQQGTSRQLYLFSQQRLKVNVTPFFHSHLTGTLVISISLITEAIC